MATRLRHKTERLKDNDLASRIAIFLDAHHVMSLATCGRSGPYAANLFYARDGFSLLWVSDRRSMHSTNIGRNPQASVTIAPDYTDFDKIRGLQMVGDAHCISDAAEQNSVRALLAKRYPALRRLSARSMIKQAYSSAEAYRFVPTRIIMTDNRRGFAHKDTLDLKPAQKP